MPVRTQYSGLVMDLTCTASLPAGSTPFHLVSSRPIPRLVLSHRIPRPLSSRLVPPSSSSLNAAHLSTALSYGCLRSAQSLSPIDVSHQQNSLYGYATTCFPVPSYIIAANNIIFNSVWVHN